jgi:hypothetical protein
MKIKEGERYQCIKDVIIASQNNKKLFSEGKVYYSEKDRHLTTQSGDSFDVESIFDSSFVEESKFVLEFEGRPIRMDLIELLKEGKIDMSFDPEQDQHFVDFIAKKIDVVIAEVVSVHTEDIPEDLRDTYEEVPAHCFFDHEVSVGDSVIASNELEAGEDFWNRGVLIYIYESEPLFKYVVKHGRGKDQCQDHYFSVKKDPYKRISRAEIAERYGVDPAKLIIED